MLVKGTHRVFCASDISVAVDRQAMIPALPLLSPSPHFGLARSAWLQSAY